jgi:tetratricopeptide (TPR) repeat protein
MSVLALAGLVGSGVVYQRGLQRALAEKEKALAVYRQAREALKTLLGRASARQGFGVPRLNELLREQQEDALAFFLKVAEQQEQSPEVRSDVVEACREAGVLQMALGRRDAARGNLERAVDLAADLAAEFSGEPQYRAALAACLFELGFCHGAADEAVRCHKEALALREELVRESPTLENRLALSQSHNSLGSMYFHQKQKKAAERHYLQAAKIHGELVREQPGSRRHRGALAEIQGNLSLVYQTTRRFPEMERYHDLAEAMLEQLVREEPYHLDSILSLALCRINWAYVLKERGQAKKALTALAKNVQALEGVRKQEPNHDLARDYLMRSHGMRAVCFEALERYPEEAIERRHVVELSRSAEVRHVARLLLVLASARAGQHAFAVKEVDELAGVNKQSAPADQLFHLGQVCAVASATARLDKMLPPEKREELAQQYADKAVAFLAQARAAARPDSWRTLLKIAKESHDFDALRSRDDFTRLLVK